jgi:hypothetical protein
LAATAALLAAAACSDSTVAPRPGSASLAASNSAPSLDLSFPVALNLGGDFTLTSNGGTFNIAGVYTVSFPGNSVCDPNLTDYSAAQWDAPCATLAQGQSIKVHGTVKLTGAGIAVDFQPELRFDPSKTVTIYTDVYAPTIVRNRSYYAAHPGDLGALAMAYSSTIGGDRIADYASDPSVITHIDLLNGRIWRRIKHFSGYNIFTGDKCVVSVDDPTCVDVSNTDVPITQP